MGLWVQRSTSPDERNCVFVPTRDLTGCSIANHSAHHHDRVHD
jgi:hypothetical protein